MAAGVYLFESQALLYYAKILISFDNLELIKLQNPNGYKVNKSCVIM